MFKTKPKTIEIKGFQILSDGSLHSMSFDLNKTPKGLVVLVHYDKQGEGLGYYYFSNNFEFSIENEKILNIYSNRVNIFSKTFEGTIELLT